MIKDLDGYSLVMVHINNKEDVSIRHLHERRQQGDWYYFRQMGSIHCVNKEWLYSDANTDLYNQKVLSDDIFRVRCDSSWEEYHAMFCKNTENNIQKSIKKIQDIMSETELRQFKYKVNNSLRILYELSSNDLKLFDKKEMLEKLEDIIENVKYQ